ncbi:hypothetical protein [Cupriavidus pampae]|uniref:hypothetical protein n=1 Tax=Cupriavidus pampae TaxID=659251 RepID=UPI001CC72212|nr:hypothetical protein [Cupriavidus pampae]
MFNVSDATRHRIEREFGRIVVQAGYEGNFGIIFDGTIKQVRRGRENQTDTYLDITAADGDSAYNFAVVNNTLSAGSTAADHVQVCTRAMVQFGVTLGYTPFGNPTSSKPTAADIADQQAKVGAARKPLDAKQSEQLALLGQVKDLRVRAEELSQAGDQAGEIALLRQAQGLLGQVDQLEKEVNSLYLPAWQREDAKLKAMQASAALPDPPVASRQGLPRGKVMFGMARDFMRWTARTEQTVWSIQDGKVIMVPETSYLPGEIPVITAETGMIGMPEQTQNGITIKMLTNPSVKIGRLIRIDNASVQRYEYSLNVGQKEQNERIQKQAKLQDDGFYYVMIAEHSGDTRGKEYYTDVFCLAADVTVLPDSLNDRGEVKPENAIKRFG